MRKFLHKNTTDRRFFFMQQLLIGCLFLVGLNSCYFDVVVTEDIDETAEISFSEDLVPVFQSSCTSCHDGEITVPNLKKQVAYESLVNGNYISVASPSTSGLITKINSDHPFAGALTDTEIQKITQWMAAGAANN